MLAGLAAPGPAGYWALLAWILVCSSVLRCCLVPLAAAGLLLVAGLVLLRFVGLSALLLGCSAVVAGAWALCLHTHRLSAQALPG